MKNEKNKDHPVFQDIVPTETAGEQIRRKKVIAEGIEAIAASLNHEINNPLTSIIGNTQLLLQKEFGGEVTVKRQLKSIEYSAVLIKRLISRLGSIESLAFLKDGDEEKHVDLKTSKCEKWIEDDEDQALQDPRLF